MINILKNISIGTDIENIKRFEKYSSNKEDAFILKIYTKSEIEYCFSRNNPAKHLAARFCAKEAVYKALCGLGFVGINFKEIEIYHDKNNVPQIKLLNKKFDNICCKVSLSHNKDNAMASVLLYLPLSQTASQFTAIDH